MKSESLVRLRTESYPHAYAAGWYALARSSELPRGKALGATLGGRRIVLFRTDTDDARVVALDGYCPHLGADLSGGDVEGDGIRCPFHRWRFDTCGRVTSIPYSSCSLKASMKTRAWYVDERCGLIFVWLDVGEASREPFYDLSPLDEIRTGGLVHRGDRDGGQVAMHISEIVENGADVQHFQFVHQQMMVPFTRVAVRGVRVAYEAGFELDSAASHVAHLRVSSTVEAMGRLLPWTRGTAHVRFIGAGAVLLFELTLPQLGRVMLIHTHTPVAPLLQEVRYRWYADRALPRALVGWLAGAWISQVQSDYGIWANKVHARRPMLVPEDGPVLEMRRWIRQFYPQKAEPIAAE